MDISVGTMLEPETGAKQNKEGRKNYDAVVYSVGTALVIVIILAFLRGFYRLKLDRKRSINAVTLVGFDI